MPAATRKVKQKRIPTSVEFRYKIVNYGADNLYPQMTEQIAARSPIVESALDALSDFTYGGGFSENGDMIVNRYDQTLNDILAELSIDYAPNDGWGLFFNVDALGMITEILPVEFKDVRFGLPNKDGVHFDVKLFAHWDADYYGQRMSKENIKTYPLWNKRMFLENVDLSLENVEKFEGFIHYWTPKMDQYPKSTFDSVFDSAQTNGEIQVFELGSVQNGFLGTSVFKHPGKFSSNTEKSNTINELGELTGAENAGSVFVVEVPANFEGEIIEQFPSNNNDNLFTNTNNNTVNRIVYRFGVPYPLLGIQPQNGGIFNQEQIKDSYIYYNIRTAKRRELLAKQFNQIMKFWHTGETSIGEILERPFIEKAEKIIETNTD